jgi:hypothetical protein
MVCKNMNQTNIMTTLNGEGNEASPNSRAERGDKNKRDQTPPLAGPQGVVGETEEVDQSRLKQVEKVNQDVRKNNNEGQSFDSREGSPSELGSESWGMAQILRFVVGPIYRPIFRSVEMEKKVAP